MDQLDQLDQLLQYRPVRRCSERGTRLLLHAPYPPVTAIKFRQRRRPWPLSTGPSKRLLLRFSLRHASIPHCRRRRSGEAVCTVQTWGSLAIPTSFDRLLRVFPVTRPPLPETIACAQKRKCGQWTSSPAPGAASLNECVFTCQTYCHNSPETAARGPMVVSKCQVERYC